MNYHVTEHLHDQRQTTIRAIRPDDKGLIMEGFPKLSADSLYRRFFTEKKDVTPQDLRQITEVDFDNVVALVAVLEKSGEDRIIAGGRYVRSGVFGGKAKAEVAFLVGDVVQGHGVASMIFRHLVLIARASGIVEFEAEVLPSNMAMLKIFDKSGYPVHSSATRESVHVTIDLTGGE